MSATISDFARTLRAELDTLIMSHTNRLVDADASKHDSIAGILKGLGAARKSIGDLAKKYQTYLDDEDDGDALDFQRRQSSLPLSS